VSLPVWSRCLLPPVLRTCWVGWIAAATNVNKVKRNRSHPTSATRSPSSSRAHLAEGIGERPGGQAAKRAGSTASARPSRVASGAILARSVTAVLAALPREACRYRTSTADPRHSAAARQMNTTLSPSRTNLRPPGGMSMRNSRP
jgi:hypothetical protein